MSPAVSIVMPVYNGTPWLEDAVASIQAQTDRDYELIVVDDGSTDGTHELLRHLERSDMRLKVDVQPHRGIVAALQRGIASSRGAYIARMDADDLAHPERIRKQRAHLDQYPQVGLVASLVDHLGHPRHQQGYAAYVTWLNTVREHNDICLQRFVESPLAHPSVMFRSKLISDYGGYRHGPFPEDYEIWLRWLEGGVRMEKISEPLLSWRDHGDRLSRQDTRYAVEAFYRCKAEYLARWLAHANPHHPDIVVWGAGRTSRQRADMLRGCGVRIRAYVDIDPRKTGRHIAGCPVWDAASLPSPGSFFVVSYVGSRGAREQIANALQQKGYEEGAHYILAA